MFRRKQRLRRSGLSLGAMVVAFALIVAACSSDDSSSTDDTSSTSSGGSDKGSLTVGSKDFPGAQILGQIYGQALEADGYDISYSENLGGTEIIYPALTSGEIDLYPEFQGTVLATSFDGTPTSDVEETNAALAEAAKADGVVVTEAAPAVDVNGFYMTEERAEELGVETLSDLAEVSSDLTLGGPPECEEREPCLLGLQSVYGIEFASVEKLDVGGPITAQNLTDGVIDVGVLFTGSSVIPDGVVLLEDDKGLQGADNPVVLVREEVDTDELNTLLNEVSAAITTEEYNQMNAEVTEEQKEPTEVATSFLERAGLV
ncbi:MAG: ABC transporter substrate-binding protein [Acidimicrobiia bacterium]|nr:ABC transporter substrate-binding protein [Acidimicrobiia bacterium]